MVFEGGDGVGKSTQAALLVEWLETQGCTTVRTREPGGSPVGAKIRDILLDPATGDVAPKAEALLYAADRAHHVETVIKPALARGDVVVSDRYVDSTLAYQGAGRTLDLADIERINAWATGGLVPHLTVILDVAPELGVDAISVKDRIEQAGADFHERVREQFLALAERDPGRYLVLPARDSIDDIAGRIRARVAAIREMSDLSGRITP